MDNKIILTIGRQFGSGGKEIGIRVAKELGIPFYDKELLQEAAKKSGLCEKIFENFDERPKSLLYSIAMDSYMFALPGSGVGDSLEQQVYLATFNTIRHIADQGPCVIIGRCADHVLRGTPLAAAYAAGGFETMAREDYVSVVCDQLELLPPGMVIGRLTGDGPAGDLLAPLWSRRKREALNAIDQELARRDSWQGKFCRKIP